MTRTTHLALAAAATLALAGCSSDPYNQKSAAGGTEHSHPDTTSGVTTDPAAGGDARGAERIARQFAATSHTYSPDTWGSQQRKLRARAAGTMAHDLEPHVPDSDTQQAMAESQLTSRASVLVSKPEKVTDRAAAVIVVLKVTAGAQGSLDEAPSYPVYRVKLRRSAGAWKVEAMDAP